ncbi:MAG: M48 family metalloprotease [Candidatus Omnitrophica bacterium]|nr:M48 family metalloprotease [Candidatus Omnitrophota bacterium]
MNVRQVFIGIVVCIFLTGCASLGSYNPATGRNEFIMIPTSEEIQMGQSVHQGLEKKYTLSTNSKYVERVNRIGQRVAMVSDRQDYVYKFFVIEGDQINAFTTPGGNVYVYTGLLDKMPSDDQIAFVIAHEIGHCAARHVIKKYQAALSYDLIGNIIFNQIDDGGRGYDLARLGSGALMSLVFSAYSRQDELEADQLGLKYGHLAGYDTNGAVEALEILEAESEGGGGPLILRSHPYLKDRIVKVKEAIPAVEHRYNSVVGHISQ